MKQTIEIPFEVADQLRTLGERIRLARIRRQKSQDELAHACGIARTTLARMESGAPGTTVGAVYAVLWALGLISTVSGIADPDADEHGKTLEAARSAKRARRSSSPVDDHDF